MANLFFITVPLAVLLATNFTLCFIMWNRIQNPTSTVPDNDVSGIRQLRKEQYEEVKTICLYLVAFAIQWSPTVVNAIWIHFNVNRVPFVLRMCTHTCPNIGGVLHGTVYFFIRRETKDETLQSENKRELKSVDVAVNSDKFLFDFIDSPQAGPKRLSTIFEEAEAKSDSLKSLRGSLDRTNENGRGGEADISIQTFERQSVVNLNVKEGKEQEMNVIQVELLHSNASDGEEIKTETSV